ncbi:hypothetical protein [Allonocardiopsis opalescens]|uniref:Uncharacterized protein n=1 Tax=Allonocardiopsis opalescens TaxID=1144618 RepID=A0A2T0Q9X1_9ACTN|nr:hypothetical protein [Allonocardiopsis opalescens]PRY00635.1 hypothetical protein CLV72_102266 [Allonocardiopsis opalescens]
MSLPWWKTDKDARFSELLRAVRTYYHPDTAQDGAPERLRRLVYRVENEGLRAEFHDIPRFLAELRAAIIDPGQVPDDELFNAACFEDGSDEAFLARVWHDIYPDRPLPTADNPHGIGN